MVYHKLVIINRKHKKSRLVLKKLNFYPIARYIAGSIFNLIIRLLGFTTLRDTQAGLKGFSAKYKNFMAKTKTKASASVSNCGKKHTIAQPGTNTIKRSAPLTVKYSCNLKMAGFWPTLLQLDGRFLQLL